MVFILVFAITVVIREILSIVGEMRKPEGSYKPSVWRLLLLGLSISYIFTIIFTGFGF